MTELKRIKFICSEYDKEKNLAKVTVKCGNDFFIGYAKANGADIERAGEFKGCLIAELKENRKALKAQLKEIKRDYNTVHEFIEKCKQSKSFDENSCSAKMMFRQENILKKKVNLIHMGIATIEKMLEAN